ncbi:uncharacterized protein K452DRAFT_74950 [Aplosporella prunicola CBS 121167]|uniref:WKF domain-containing protein n=1 Tax=Aplosporella prunicola CBS 121167 TaxID=1176127 RepID=A0A6A6B573_9PEZI|nr:uncharacterized protein K452DRAFT_74950 [Aplosporella prunicola CBS 121167]KAF2139299.1 hypothetical protein K452DRAFT_74950 [Aplosporella prunicola CBS 121167]
MASHVPAWKRLGLRLKNAKEEPQVRSDTKKRPHSGEEGQQNKHHHVQNTTPSRTGEEGQKKTKKRKLAEAQPVATSPSTNGEDKPKATPAVATPTKPSLSRKKSVTFTPDTKGTDGDSGQQWSKAWFNSQQDKPEESTPEETSTSPVNGGPGEPSKKNLKKAKKEQRKAEPKATASERSEGKDLPPYVRYLEQYSADRANWKFNKSKQIDLFKHLFNVYRIPHTYDPAIEAYVAGLQGAAARYRLQQSSKEALNETSDVEDKNLDMDSSVSRKAAHDAALETHLDNSKKRRADEEVQQKLRKRKRAQKILSVLGEVTAPEPKKAAETTVPESGAETQPPANQKRTRQRKKRTEVSDDDDSSDSSSSSEDESSSDESSDDESDDASSDASGSSAVSSSSEDTSSEESNSDSDPDSDSDSDSGSSSN